LLCLVAVFLFQVIVPKLSNRDNENRFPYRV
jgi:hypothetical protein